MCIAQNMDDKSVRIATGTRDRNVHVWKWGLNRELQVVFSVQLDATVPKAIGFIDNAAQDLHVFGFFDGIMYVYCLCGYAFPNPLAGIH